MRQKKASKKPQRMRMTRLPQRQRLNRHRLKQRLHWRRRLAGTELSTPELRFVPRLRTQPIRNVPHVHLSIGVAVVADAAAESASIAAGSRNNCPRSLIFSRKV